MGTCIITGAGTGIGRASAINLADSPHYDKFVLLSLGMEDLKETERQMRRKIGEAKEIVLYDQDITQHDMVRDIVKDTYERFKSIDALLNIAGFAKECPFFDTPLELFKFTFEINIMTMFNLTQAVAECMKETGGVIVNVASTSGSTPRPNWIAYASSKSAVIGFSRTLTHELADYGIKVFNVSPGRCDTAMRSGLCPDEDVKGMMKPDAVGRIIADFANNPGNCIDGQDIIVRKLN